MHYSDSHLHPPSPMADAIQTMNPLDAPAPLIVARRTARARTLGGFERFFWIADQTVPRHFAVTALVTGPTTPAQWREAINKVQRQHPLLSVSIEQGPEGSLCFRPATNCPIPLRLVVGYPQAIWEEEVARELGDSIDPTQAPLIRATLIMGPGNAALILTAHHSVADGLSLVYVIRDILQALGGTFYSGHAHAAVRRSKSSNS